jgi:hypothetical protein
MPIPWYLSLPPGKLDFWSLGPVILSFDLTSVNAFGDLAQRYE